MKKAQKLLTLLFFTTLFFSCTPQSLSDGELTPNQEVHNTGGDQSAEMDEDKDGD